MGKIARIRNDGILLLTGEIREEIKKDFDSYGNLYIPEVIEVDGFSGINYLSFDGVDDTIENIATDNINWHIGTWEFWIKNNTDYSSLPTNYYESFFNSEQYSPNFRLRAFARGSAKIYFSFVASGGTITGFNASELAVGEWSHIAITYSNITGIGKTYLNGILKTEAPFIDPISDLRTPMYLGRCLSYSKFAGSMKEFRVWDKELSLEEIQDVMSKTLIGNEDGLVIYLPMNEGIGDIVIDKTGNGSDGLISGAIWESEGSSNKIMSISDKLYTTELIEGVNF